jgi:hypothetical protein
VEDDFALLWSGDKPRFYEPAYVDYQNAKTLANKISIRRKLAARRGGPGAFQEFETWREQAVEEYLRVRAERERASAIANWRPNEPVDKTSVLAEIWPGEKPRMSHENYSEYQLALRFATRLENAADKAAHRARKSPDPWAVWDAFLAERAALLDDYRHARLQRQAEAARERIADREIVERASAAAFFRTARKTYGLEIDVITGRVSAGPHGGRFAGSYARVETAPDAGTLIIEGEGFEITRPLDRRGEGPAREFATDYNRLASPAA